MRVRRGPLADRKDDFHRTPVEAVLALVTIEPQMPRQLWEPACGDGAIVEPLRQAGFSVQATDLVDRGCPGAESRVDFLLGRVRPSEPFGGIVTNPPYKLAQPFVVKALSWCPYVAMLLPLTFLAGVERHPWHRGGWLARVHVSSRRLPMMHRENWAGRIATSTVDHAWFVWDQAHEGEPVVRWFDYDHL